MVELPARSDLRIVFELIPERDGSALSDASSLVDLGIDPSLLSLGDRPAPAEQSTSRPGIAWVIVAAIAALLALVLLTIWSRLGGSAESESDNLSSDVLLEEVEDEHVGYDGVAIDGG